MRSGLTPNAPSCPQDNQSCHQDNQAASMPEPIDATVKRALMTLLRRGAITVGDAARLGAVSRQAVLKWVKAEGLDIAQRHSAFAAREFKRLLVTDRKASKAELRRQAEEAEEMWRWRHGKDGLGPGRAQDGE